MASALLIYPWIYDFAAYDLWLKLLGLLYIASILRKLAIKVNFIDCLDRYHESLSPSLGNSVSEKKYGCGTYYYEEVEKPQLLKKFPRKYKRYGLPVQFFLEEIGKLSTPDIILVSSGMTYWYPGAFETIKTLKVKFPEVPIILGGTYATLCYQHALESSGADYVFKGGDLGRLIRLVEEITGADFSKGKLPLDSFSYPYPAYDLYRRNEYVAIRTSMGCPFRCTYCAVNLLNGKFEQRKPELVVREIEHFHKNLSVKNFVFYTILYCSMNRNISGESLSLY
ncbi:MAG: B12-binding domain-containing radical SAM protein [bacterium]